LSLSCPFDFPGAKQELLFHLDAFAEEPVALVLPVNLGSICAVKGMEQFRFLKEQLL
jgi:hypothetical protein